MHETQREVSMTLLPPHRSAFLYHKYRGYVPEGFLSVPGLPRCEVGNEVQRCAAVPLPHAQIFFVSLAPDVHETSCWNLVFFESYPQVSDFPP